MLEAVLFDLDGTMADTAPDLGAAVNQLLREEGLTDKPLPLLRPYTSQGVRGLLKALSRGGVVAAEEMAPFLDPRPSQLAPDRGERVAVDEGYVLPALVRLRGSAEVGPAGQILYRFPELQATGGKVRCCPGACAPQQSSLAGRRLVRWPARSACRRAAWEPAPARVRRRLAARHPEASRRWRRAGS